MSLSYCPICRSAASPCSCEQEAERAREVEETERRRLLRQLTQDSQTFSKEGYR